MNFSAIRLWIKQTGLLVFMAVAIFVFSQGLMLVTAASASLPSGSLDINTVVGNGSAGTATDGASATGAVLQSPTGVAETSQGIYIADNVADLVEFVPFASGTYYGQSMTGGDIYVVAGGSATIQPASGLSATGVKFSSVNDVVVDGSGNIYLADADDEIVGFVPASNGTHFGVAMTADDFYIIAGQVTVTGNPASGSAATSTDLNGPQSVALGTNGVYIVSNSEEINFIPFSSGSYYGQSMTANDIYILAGIAGTAGNPTSGSPATSTDLNGPSGLAIDSNGDIAVSNRYGNEVNFIPVTTGTYYGLSMTAYDIYTLTTSVNYPLNLAMDSSGDIFIANSNDNVIDIIPATTGTYYGQSMTDGSLYAVAGDGTAGLSGNGSVSTSAELNAPGGVFAESNGTFYIADTNNHEIRVVAPPPAFTSSASGTLTYNTSGSISITTTGSPTNNITESGTLPGGVAFTNNGNDTATISGTPTSTGTFNITLTASNADGSANQSFTLTVNPASQSITFTSSAPSETYGSTTSYTPTATATSGLAVTFSIDSSSTAGTCSIASGTVSFSAVGTCVIDANQAGNSDYSAATQVQQSVTVSKASQSITFTSSAPSETYGSTTSYTPTATATSGLAVTFSIDSSSTAGTCSIASGTVSFSGAGTCVIDANQAGNSDYSAATQVQQSITVSQESQTISFTSSAPSETYGSTTPYTPTATATSGLAVTFTIASSSSSVCSISSGVVSFSAGGSCVIDANQAGNSNYSAAAEVQQVITVSQESQSISFTSTIPTETYGSTTSYTPTATATSGLAVTFSIASSSSSVCSISSGVVSFSDGGSCIIDANQAGNSNYSAAAEVQQIITVSQESQTISFTSSAPSETYGSTTPYTPTATATSGLAVTFSIDPSSTAGTCSIASGTVSFSDGGSCIIDANQAGNSNYASAPQVQQVITVDQESQTITFTSSAPSETYGSTTPYTPTATATSGLAVTFSIDPSSTAGTCSIASGTVSFSDGGSCIIDANQAGNSNYSAAPQVQQSITVAKASQSITFTSSAPSETYGSTVSYTPTATATSGLAVTFSIDPSSTAGTCSIASGVISFSSAGTCVIDANQAGNSNYSAAPQVQQSVTVAKVSQTVSFTSTAPSETYGSTTSYTPTATATSGLAVTFSIDSSSTAGTCSIVSGTISFTDPGTCVIDANQAGNANYSAAGEVQQVIAVSKESQSITFTSTAPSETYGSTASYTPTATATSGLAVTFSIDSSSTAGTCSISSGTVSFSATGTCIIDANQAGNSNYASAPQVQQSVIVSKASQSITFTSTAPSETYGSTVSYTPTANATSGLAVTFSIDPSSTAGTCSIASGVISFSSAGTCVIDANQAGNSNYSAAPQVQQSITVAKASQSITFTSSAPSETYGSTVSYTPTATATSGLAVTFSIDPSSTAGTCSISSGVVSFTDPGTCVIDANQAGNSDYASAGEAQQVIAVSKASQSITLTSSAPSETYGSTTSYTPTATATSGLTVTFSIDSSSTAGTCSISSGVVSFAGGGNCIIDANQSGNSYYSAAPQVQQSVTVIKASQSITFTSSIPSETYGSTVSYTPTATATSGLFVTFSIDPASASICSISSGVVSFVAGGTCAIDANQAGNSDYASAPQVQQSVTVSKESQTISFTSGVPTDALAGGASYTPTATATSGLAVTFSIDSSSTSGTCSIASGVVSFSAGGTCIIDANQMGNTDFQAAPQVQQSITVGEKAQSISFTSSIPSETYGSTTSYTPTATATSGLTVTFSIDPASAAACSISSGTVSFTDPGSCIIDANQAGNTDFQAAPQVQQSVTVSKESQTVSFTSSVPSETYGSTVSYTPTATATSGLTPVFTINIVSASVCSISSGVVSFSSGGSCIIDANQAGNTDFQAAPQVQQSVTVVQESQTVSFTSTAPSETYGSTSSYTPTATATSGLPVTFSIDLSSTTGTCSISSGTVSFSAGGTCVIDANQAGNSDYSAATQVQQVVTVSKESQTIAFTSAAPLEARVGGFSYTPTATATSGLTVTFSIDPSSAAGTCSIASGSISFSAPGTCIIDANQAGNTDYHAAAQLQQAFQVIQGTNPGSPSDINATYGVDSLNFSWDQPSNTGGLPISYYVVQLKNITTGTTSQSTDAYSTSYDATSLAAGDSYQLSVAAVNSAGQSPFATSDTYEAVSVTASSGATWSGVAVSSNQGITVGTNVPGSSTISATASSGVGTVSVSGYPSSPFPKLSDLPGSKFFGTNLSSQENFGSVSVEICGVQSGGSVKWWNPTTQTLETPSDITDLGNGCFAINTNSTSIPNVQDLIGGTFVSLPGGSSALLGGSGGDSNGGSSPYYYSSGTNLVTKVIVSKSVSLIRKGAQLGVSLTCEGPVACRGKITILVPEKVKKHVRKVVSNRGNFYIVSGKTKAFRYNTTKLGKSIFLFDIKHHVKLKPAQFIVTLINSRSNQVSFYYPHLDVPGRLSLPAAPSKYLNMHVDCEAKFTCKETAILFQRIKVGTKFKLLVIAHRAFILKAGQGENISMFFTKTGKTVVKGIKKAKSISATLGLRGSFRMNKTLSLLKK